MCFKSYLVKKIKLFSKNEEGNVLIMFSLLLLPLVFVTGWGFDYAMQTKYQQRLQAANDITALAVAKEISGDINVADAKLIALADVIYRNNMGVNDSKIFNLEEMQIERDEESVVLSRNGQVNTSLMSIFGFDKMNIAARTKIGLHFSNVEMALILDMSGSMGGGKMSNLKSASLDLVDILMKTNDQRGVRLAFVPWSTGVNVSNINNMNIVNSNSRANCAYIRDNDLSDSRLRNNQVSTSWGCPSSKIIPLTYNKQMLKQQVATWSAGGGTSSDSGMFWGQGVLAPSWDNVWGSEAAGKPYAAVRKFAILMSDGVNNSGKNDTNTIEICNNMKAAGTHVYAIGFQAPAGALAMLKQCATDSNSYIAAGSGNDLKEAFGNIASEISNLYISE